MHQYEGLFDPGEGDFVDPFSEFFFEGLRGAQEGSKEAATELGTLGFRTRGRIEGGVNPSPGIRGKGFGTVCPSKPPGPEGWWDST